MIEGIPILASYVTAATSRSARLELAVKEAQVASFWTSVRAKSRWAAVMALGAALIRCWPQKPVPLVRMTLVGFLLFRFFFTCSPPLQEGSASHSEVDDADVGDDQLFAAMTGGAAQPESKKRKKTKLKHKSTKKRAVGHCLVGSIFNGGATECLLCHYVFRTPFADIKPENVTRHWRKEHNKELDAVQAANDDGKDLSAVVKTLIASHRPQEGFMDAFRIESDFSERRWLRSCWSWRVRSLQIRDQASCSGTLCVNVGSNLRDIEQ